MTAIKQTTRAAGYGVSALVFVLACLWLSWTIGSPSSARNELPALPADTAEVYRRHAVELLFQHKDDPKGFEFYQKAIELAGKDYGPHSSYLSDLYFEMASAEKEAGKFTLAEQHFYDALKIKPNAVNVRLQLAALYKRENKSKELYHQLQEIKTKDPATAQVQQAFLTLYSQDKKRPDQAARAALVVHQMGAIQTQALASAKAAGWFNPLTTQATTAPASATAAPRRIPSPPALQEETDSRALKLKTPQETAAAIVTPAPESPNQKQSTTENPTASTKEVSVSPLGVFSRMLSPHRAADRAEAAKKLRREQEQLQMAERERNRQRLEREQQRVELARRQSSQAQRAATRHGAQPVIAVAKPAQSKVAGPALRTTAKKVNGKSGEAKPVEAKAIEAKPLEVKESKTAVDAAPKETAKEAQPETAFETPAAEPVKPKKRKSNPFNLVGVTPSKMPGELDRPGESNSENQPKAAKTVQPTSALNRANLPHETMPPPMQEAPPPKQTKQARSHGGLVPPPPPTMAYPQAFYGGGGYPPPMIPAQMMVQPPIVQQQQAPHRRAARREPPPEEDEDKPAAAPAHKGDDDWIIEWGGTKKKKARSAD